VERKIIETHRKLSERGQLTDEISDNLAGFVSMTDVVKLVRIIKIL
jgi:hypothetical protein